MATISKETILSALTVVEKLRIGDLIGVAEKLRYAPITYERERNSIKLRVNHVLVAAYHPASKCWMLWGNESEMLRVVRDVNGIIANSGRDHICVDTFEEWLAFLHNGRVGVVAVKMGVKP